jgi:purine-binding chemotaxis protein CheW
MLILRIGDRVYGTIVDKIDKVVGINSDTIQPPHPIFGDINIKFISGVVEKQGDLYIILDVIRIFTQSEEEKQKPRGTIQENAAVEPAYTPPPVSPEQAAEGFDTALGFVKESLAALKRFTASPVNEEWLRTRFTDWSAVRTEADLQIKNNAEAEEFLAPFYSPHNGAFWDDDYAAAVKAALPDMPSNNIQVWDLGCGKGYESFSLACILKARYPDGHIKIWANDNDIMAISSAPNMVFDLDEVPEYARGLMVRGRNGYSFNQTIKDSITFEYHDVLNDNLLPELDIIVARDMVSFFAAPEQEKLLNDFSEKLKGRGIILLGRNEQLPGEWRPVAKDPVSAFMRN